MELHTLIVYFCRADYNDFFSRLILSFVKLFENKISEKSDYLTHVFFELDGKFLIEYTNSGVYSDEYEYSDIDSSITDRIEDGLVVEFYMKDEEFQRNMHKLLSLRPMGYTSFFDNSKPICTDVLFILLGLPYQRLTPTQLYNVIRNNQSLWRRADLIPYGTIPKT